MTEWDRVPDFLRCAAAIPPCFLYLHNTKNHPYEASNYCTDYGFSHCRYVIILR